MEAFARSSTTLFARASIRKPLSASKPLLGRSDICLSRSLNSDVHVHRTFRLRHKDVHSVAPPHQPEVVTSLEAAGIEFQTTVLAQTVHVQFQLHKKCKYGESFLVVGNEPVLGQWNLSSAVPLNWSDGNIWTVELDIPVGTPVQYKFILKKDTGDVLWQPGPDRILHTWNTKNTIAIAEDWNDSVLQKISEVQIMNQNKLVNPGLGPIVPGNVAHPGSADDKPPSSSKNELIFAETAIHSENGTLLSIRNDLRVPDEGNCVIKEEAVMKTTPTNLTSRSLISVEDEDEETLPTYEGGSVLVPGLTPILGGASNEETLPKGFSKIMPSAESLPKGLGKPMTSQQATPKGLGRSMPSEAAIPKLTKPMSPEEALPKELRKSTISQQAISKELPRSVPSAEALPEELAKTMSSEEALPKELRRPRTTGASCGFDSTKEHNSC